MRESARQIPPDAHEVADDHARAPALAGSAGDEHASEAHAVEEELDRAPYLRRGPGVAIAVVEGEYVDPRLLKGRAVAEVEDSNETESAERRCPVEIFSATDEEAIENAVHSAIHDGRGNGICVMFDRW